MIELKLKLKLNSLTDSSGLLGDFFFSSCSHPHGLLIGVAMAISVLYFLLPYFWFYMKGDSMFHGFTVMPLCSLLAALHQGESWVLHCFHFYFDVSVLGLLTAELASTIKHGLLER